MTVLLVATAALSLAVVGAAISNNENGDKKAASSACSQAAQKAQCQKSAGTLTARQTDKAATDCPHATKVALTSKTDGDGCGHKCSGNGERCGDCPRGGDCPHATNVSLSGKTDGSSCPSSAKAALVSKTDGNGCSSGSGSGCGQGAKAANASLTSSKASCGTGGQSGYHGIAGATRTVKKTATGVIIEITSDDPEVVAAIQARFSNKQAATKVVSAKP